MLSISDRICNVCISHQVKFDKFILNKIKYLLHEHDSKCFRSSDPHHILH